VAALHCDFLSATGRKFLRGPRGSGFLYVADHVLDRGLAPLWIDLRGARWTAADVYAVADSARRFENWEFAWANVLGLGAAARYACRFGVGEAGAYAASLAAAARERLAALPGARVLDRGAQLCAIVAVAFDGHDAGDIVRRLRDQAINTSVIRREDAVLDLDGRGVETAVRISPHYYNSSRDIDTLVFALEEFAAPS
jgi:selenocysteine lyase/cysteine desulfurase